MFKGSVENRPLLCGLPVCRWPARPLPITHINVNAVDARMSGACLKYHIERRISRLVEMRKAAPAHHLLDVCRTGLRAEAERPFLGGGKGPPNQTRAGD